MRFVTSRRGNDTELSPAEARAEREAAGVSVEQLATLLKRPVDEVLEWEAGLRPVPAGSARQLREYGDWGRVCAQRRAISQASALPRCAVADELSSVIESGAGASVAALPLLRAMGEHSLGCKLCQARHEEMETLGPPMPSPGRPRWLVWILDHVPAVLRPPAGRRGEARREALSLAASLTFVVAVGFTIHVVASLVSDDMAFEPAGNLLRTFAVVMATYFVGFYLAGAAIDMGRAMKSRFLGHIASGAGALAALAIVFAVAMPIIEPSIGPIRIHVSVVGGACVGAVAGAVMWIGDTVQAWRRRR